MNKDDKDNQLSREEVEVNSILAEASQRVDAIEQQIKNLPPDKGPSYELRPPGSSPTRPAGTRAQMEERLKGESEKITSDAKDRAGKVIENSNPEVRQKAGDTIERWRNPDYKEKGDEKTIDQSQSYLQRKMNREGMDKGQQPTQEKVEPSQTPQPDVPQSGSMSMSARFNATLGYSDWKQEADKDSKDKTPDKPEKPREIDLDKD